LREKDTELENSKTEFDRKIQEIKEKNEKDIQIIRQDYEKIMEEYYFLCSMSKK